MKRRDPDWMRADELRDGDIVQFVDSEYPGYWDIEIKQGAMCVEYGLYNRIVLRFSDHQNGVCWIANWDRYQLLGRWK